jgi:hypothetical protein
MPGRRPAGVSRSEAQAQQLVYGFDRSRAYQNSFRAYRQADEV